MVTDTAYALAHPALCSRGTGCCAVRGGTAFLLAAYTEACGFQAQALAASTTAQYHAHVRYFAEFCVITQGPFERPPEKFVCAYVAYLARSLRPSSVTQYLKGLRDHYVQQGYPVFASSSEWPDLYRTLKGIKRSDRSGPAKKRPVTPEMLQKYRGVLNLATPAHCALWACALISFFGYFRKSNTTVPRGTLPLQQGKCLRGVDVVVDVGRYALTITAPGSKTRQFGAAPTIQVAGQVGHPLDPVAAWLAHRAVNRLGDPAASLCQAFSYVSAQGRVALTHDELVNAAKTMATLVGLDPGSVAGHSFRRGGASYAFQAGVPDVLIQRQGDWLSACYREYIVLSPEKALQATRQMFALMAQPTAGGGLREGFAPLDNLPAATSVHA
jgi:hypothetical protein